MAARRGSNVVMGGSNPLQTEGGGGNGAIVSDQAIESIAGSHIIKASEFRDIVDVLTSMTENAARIAYLDKAKRGFLFSSKQLHDLLLITESLKTRIAFIESVCPRVTDPQTMTQTFMDMFRYEDDRARVEQAFKARNETIRASTFNAKGAGALSTGGRGAGRGGAGRGGAGRGIGAGRGGAAIAPKPQPALDMEGCVSTDEVVPTPAPAQVVASRSSISPFSQTPVKVEESSDSETSEKDDVGIMPLRSSVVRKSSLVLPARRPSVMKSVIIESAEDEQARLKRETEAAEKEELAEISAKERATRAQINLVVAALDLKLTDFTGADRSLELWEIAAMESVEGSEQAQSSSSTVKPFTPIKSSTPVAKSSTPSSSTPLVKSQPAVPDAGSNDSSNARRTSGGIRAEDMPAPGSLASMKNAFESGFKTAGKDVVVTPARVSSGARNIFSPTRVSNSPEGALTPPPRALSGQTVDSSSLLKDSITFGTDGICEVNGQKYNAAQIDQAKKFAGAVGCDLLTFLSLPQQEAVEKNDQGEDMYSYQELMRKHFLKSYANVDQRKLEYFLTEKEFQHVFNMTKLEWYNQPQWKKVAQRQSSLLF